MASPQPCGSHGKELLPYLRPFASSDPAASGNLAASDSGVQIDFDALLHRLFPPKGLKRKSHIEPPLVAQPLVKIPDAKPQPPQPVVAAADPPPHPTTNSVADAYEVQDLTFPETNTLSAR